MICQICNSRPANFHLTKVVNGIKSEIHVCEQCAREEGLGVDNTIPNFDTPFSFSNILAGLMDFGGSGAVSHPIQRQVKCPGCGMDYESFKNTGRFGCSQCYEVFGERLEPLFRRIHGSTQHTGKVPKRTGGIIRIKRDIEKLKYELKRAVESEEYEKAVELRDRIKELESKNGI